MSFPMQPSARTHVDSQGTSRATRRWFLEASDLFGAPDEFWDIPEDASCTMARLFPANIARSLHHSSHCTGGHLWGEGLWRVARAARSPERRWFGSSRAELGTLWARTWATVGCAWVGSPQLSLLTRAWIAGHRRPTFGRRQATWSTPQFV